MFSMEIGMRLAERAPGPLAPALVLGAHVGIWLFASKRSSRDGGSAIVRVATLRAIGLVYVSAFLTLALNFEACLGEDGLEPVERFMRNSGRSQGMGLVQQWGKFLKMPTVLWFVDASSATQLLRILIWANLGLAGLVVCGVSHCFALGILWLSFVSCVNVGQRMWGYGWHPQLCEFGFLCIFLGTPLRVWDSANDDGLCPAGMWLLRWLLFRSLFEPGMGKIFGGDPAWWPELSALRFHYFTQPSPNPVAWFMHAMPASVHVLSCIFNHLVECLLPVCLIVPVPSIRHCVACLVVVFMSVLILTGNYAYLQYLMLAQTVPAFNNDCLAWVLNVPLRPAPQVRFPSRFVKVFLGWALVVFILRRSVAPLAEVLAGTRAADYSYDQWHLVNGYAAFSHMTKTRPEVIIEARTSAGWESVDFWCKVGQPQQKPCVISPLDLPIDWSLWFVPLGNVYSHPWLFVLLDKILCGSPAIKQVVRYMPENVMEVRVNVYEYIWTSHDADWSQAASSFGKYVAEVWHCADRRSTPWIFFIDVWKCVMTTDFEPAASTGLNYVYAQWSPMWWQRKFVKTVVPAVGPKVLRDMLRENNLPAGCGPTGHLD